MACQRQTIRGLRIAEKPLQIITGILGSRCAECRTWLERAQDRRTLLFGCNVRHSEVPAVGCLIMARPTLSETVYIQQLGRGMRTAEGKRDCMVLDHTPNARRFGSAVDYVPPPLDPAEMKIGHAPANDREPKLRVCPECEAGVPTGAETCPECGVDMPVRSPRVIEVAGELSEMGKPRVPRVETVADQMIFYRMTLWLCIKWGWNPGAAYVRTKNRFSHLKPPPWGWRDLPPLEPMQEVIDWHRSQNIRYAKRHA